MADRLTPPARFFNTVALAWEGGQMKRSALSIQMVVAAALVLPMAMVIPAQPSRSQALEMWNTNCRKLLKSYLGKPGHKAFAVSNTAHDISGQACGYDWSAPSKKTAEARAVKACNSRAGGCVVIRSE
jgi:hypothetical protein